MSASHMLTSAISLSLLANTKAATVAKAVFGNTGSTSGVTGSISALDGFVWLNLDFSGVNWTAPSLDNCYESGMTWHIHDAWTYNDNDAATAVDRMLSECGRTFTGNHYDPWFGCGTFSEEPDCTSQGGCIPGSTIYQEIEANANNEYICSPSNFSDIAYSCEVGDWSGKYGKLYLDDNLQVTYEGDTTFGSYWEPSTDNLLGSTSVAIKSVVIHCGGVRAFCAPFLSGDDADPQTIDLTETETLEVAFDDAGTDFEGMSIKWMQSSGQRQVEISIPSTATSQCASWAPYLFAEWPTDGDFAGRTAMTNCDLTALGGIYDPTHSCISNDYGNSSSAYCQDGVRCPDGDSPTTTTYSCAASNSYYGCAVGDIYGRIMASGSVAYPGNTFDDNLSPPLWSLNNGKAIVFVCMDSSPAVENICALTIEAPTTTMAETTVASGGCMMQLQLALFSTLLAFVILFA